MEIPTLPSHFALNCNIKSEQFGDWIIDITELIRLHELNALHHNVFPGDPSMKITPRGQRSNAPGSSSGKTAKRIKFITVGREIKELIRSLFSLLYVEIFMACIHLHHRLMEVRHLQKFGMEVHKDIMDDKPKARIKLEHWVKSFNAYQIRNGNPIDDETFAAEPIERLMQVQNKRRLLNRLELSLKTLGTSAATTYKTPVVTLIDVNDAILIKQPDFKYPFDASFLEFFVARRELGFGIEQVKNIVGETKHGSIPIIYNAIRTTFISDFKEELFSAIESDGISSEIKQGINVTTEFIEEVSHVFANAVIDLSVLSYNYAKAQTDNAATVTIQLKAFKTMLLSAIPYEFTGLNVTQLECIRLLTLSYITERKGKKE